MKKFISSMKTKLIPLLLLFIMTLAAVILPAATLRAFALPGSSLKDPSLWQGGGGGGNSNGEPQEITAYVNSAFADELNAYMTLTSLETNEESNKKYKLTSYDYVQSRITSRPTATESYNTIDYVLYMIRELEGFARDFITDSNIDFTKTYAKNLVLGYIRGINSSYYEEANDGNWKIVAGPIDTNFITYVRENDKISSRVTVLQFFASFLQDANLYNRSVYGDIDSSFLNKHYSLSDPLGSGQTIDLLHMFASIDGTFQSTEQDIAATTVAHNLQRQAVSWLGDLVTYSSELQEYTSINTLFPRYTASMGHIDFNDYVDNYATTFSSDDLLADIDAFNATKFFLDNPNNSLSNSIAAYYNETSSDSSTQGNRYYQFIYTSVMEKRKPADNNNILNHFKDHVYYFLNLQRTGDTAHTYNYYANEMGFVGGNIFSLLLESGLTAPVTVRTFCAQLFCDYIVTMSHRT